MPIPQRPEENTRAYFDWSQKSYRYINWWMARYRLKNHVWVPISSVLVFILVFIELIGPLTHALSEGSAPGRLSRVSDFLHGHGYLVAGILFVVALYMVREHFVLHKRSGRFREYAAYVIGVEETGRNSADAAELIAQSILDALVRVLERKERKDPTKGPINASLLYRELSGGGPFDIYAQDRSKIFQATATIPADASAAGNLITWQASKVGKRGALMYLPKTYFAHGVCLWNEKNPEGPLFSEFGPVNLAFSDLGHGTSESLVSLACVQIPLKDQNCCGVLCVGSERIDRFGEIDFVTIKTTATLLAPYLPVGQARPAVKAPAAAAPPIPPAPPPVAGAANQAKDTKMPETQPGDAPHKPSG